MFGFRKATNFKTVLGQSDDVIIFVSSLKYSFRFQFRKCTFVYKNIWQLVSFTSMFSF